VKTQIINLEPSDDIASVLDKLNWVKAGRVILVWPGRNRVLTNRLDLRLIQRSIERRSAQVGIVSLDPDVQANAKSLGIPVFENLTNLHRETWPENPPRKISLTARNEARSIIHELQDDIQSGYEDIQSSMLRISIFAVAIVAMILTLALLVPSAEIIIDPVRMQHEEQIIIEAPLAGSSQIPEIVHLDRVRVEGDIRIPTSGINFEPGGYAHGIVEFENLGDDTVIVPAGTTIRVPENDQMFFSTQTRIVLPAGTDSTRTVEITASQPGPGGNIPAGRITAVDGSLGLLVSVINPEATTGGSLSSRSAVAAYDFTQAKQILNDQLLTQAMDLMQANVLPTQRILEESLSFDQVLEEDYDREIGETADTVELHVSAVARVALIDLTTVNSKVESLLSTAIGSDAEIVPDTLQIDGLALEEPLDPESSDLEVSVSYYAYSPLDLDQIRKDVIGMRQLRAQRYLSDHLHGNNFQIDLHPDWYPLLPIFQPQLEVRYIWEGKQ
jgi:hypothetical protein